MDCALHLQINFHAHEKYQMFFKFWQGTLLITKPTTTKQLTKQFSQRSSSLSFLSYCNIGCLALLISFAMLSNSKSFLFNNEIRLNSVGFPILISFYFFVGMGVCLDGWLVAHKSMPNKAMQVK